METRDASASKNCVQYRIIDMTFIDIGWFVGVFGLGALCARDHEPHMFLYISDENGSSKLNKVNTFDQKWIFWNLVAKFDKELFIKLCHWLPKVPFFQNGHLC